jgi:prepilin signal peptidase PulO-like enzyme (type II secretory pathway)
MKTLRSYPGVLTLLIFAVGLSINAFVDYLHHQIASPSLLASVACVVSAFAMVLVYEYKNYRLERKRAAPISVKG